MHTPIVNLTDPRIDLDIRMQWTVTVRWGNEAEFLDVTAGTKALARERAVERLRDFYQPGGEIVSIELYTATIHFF